MVDRTIAYTNELLRSQDFLQAQKDTLYAVGYLAQMVLGIPGPTDAIPGNSWLDGLVCAPTVPASLQVTVGTGSIYQMETVDAAAYGVLGVDSNVILKQGLLLSPVTLTVTPPNTSGYDQYYLIEAIYTDLDGGSTVLPYLNSLNPLQPFAGPGNNGSAQFTIRQGLVSIALKPGVAAPAGTETIPTPDAGYTALFTVHVINGQTQITSSNIATYNYFPDTPAPFVVTKLPLVPPAIQAQKDNYVQDTGTANNIQITLPQWTNQIAGLAIRIKKAVANTGAVTLSLNGGPNQTVQWGDTSALSAGDWPANDIGYVVWDGSEWQLISMPGPTIFARVSGPLAGLVHFGFDTGTANAMSVTSVTPPISSVTQGMQFEIVKSAASTTGATTLNVQGTAGTLFWADGSTIQANDWPGSAIGIVIYDGTNYRLESVMGPTVYQRVLPPVALVHYGVAAGTNTLTTTTTPTFPSMTDGIIVELTAAAANTGAVTLAPNGLAAAAVELPNGSALPAGTFQASTSYLLGALGGVWKILANYTSGSSSGLTNIQVITATGTYTPTSGAAKAIVIITGGGGGGGVALSCGPGGGAGATAIVMITISGTVPVTIGAGGSSNTAPQGGSATGGNGSQSTFGSFATAGGGSGGPGGDAGGQGGTATVGTMRITGGDGETALSGPGFDSGNGGASFWGGGGAGGAASSAGPGMPGRAYGSGGGGTDSDFGSSGGRTSGSGAQGVALILEF